MPTTTTPLNCTTTLPTKKEFHETMLSLISLNDPSDRAVLLWCANTLSYIHGQFGAYDTEAWKYYIYIYIYINIVYSFPVYG